MSDNLSETLRIETFISQITPVNQDPDSTRQLDNQQLNIRTWLLPSLYQNPTDTTRQLDAQGVTLHTFLECKQITDEIKNANFDLDAEGNVAMSTANVDFFALTKANNPTDNARQLDNQLANIYTFEILTIDNPPWVHGDVVIIPQPFITTLGIKLKSEKLALSTTIGAYQYHGFIEASSITDTYKINSVLNVNDYKDSFTGNSALEVVSETHKITNAIKISDTYDTIQVLPYKECVLLNDQINFASQGSYVAVDYKLRIQASLLPNVTRGDTKNSNVFLYDFMSVHSEQTHIREHREIRNFFAQFYEIQTNALTIINTLFDVVVKNPEHGDFVEKVQIQPAFSVRAINPEYIYLTANKSIWHENYKIEALDPPPWCRSKVFITPTLGIESYTPPGLHEADEQLEHYIILRSWLTASETANYRDVLAVATWMEHTPHSRALLQEKLTLKFDVLETKGGHDELWAKVEIKDFLKISSKDLKNILEFVRISDFYRAEGGTSEEEYTTYVINEDNETTRYEHWPFESYAAFKGVHFGCGPDGIYELTGDDDNGEPIAAMINFGKQSFGSSQMKRVPYVYASLASDGDLYMQVSYTDDNVYMYPARKVDEYNATVRFDLGRGIKANYLNFELYNENGSKFDLRNVWIYLTELSRRI